MKMWNPGSIDEREHVIRSCAVPECTRGSVHETPDGCSFVVRQVAQTRDVTLRLDHQVAAVDGRAAHGVHVAHVDEVVLVEHATLGRITARLLVTDETGAGGHDDILPQRVNLPAFGDTVVRPGSVSRECEVAGAQ